MSRTTHVHDWLSLVSLSGLLVSEPVLVSAFPQGPERLEPHLLRRFGREWERFRLRRGIDPQGRWLDFILHDLLGLGLDRAHRLLKGQQIPPETVVDLLEVSQSLRPSQVLADSQGAPRLLIGIVPVEQGVDRIETATGRWKASPFTKFDRLLRESGVPLGLLTNGLEWRLVYAVPGLTTAHLSWQAQSWADERVTLDAFYTLLRAERFRSAGREITTLLELIRQSQERQVDVADQLGEQVRAAVGLFVQALDAADRASGGDLLRAVPLDQVYELSISLMMRLVFILYAEENGLLPHGEVLYDRGYGLTYLAARLENERRGDAETFNRAADAWGQLLAVFRLIFAGSPHPDLALRPYGGDLFDPARYHGLLEDPRLGLTNAAVYAILRRLTFARARLGRDMLPQRVSYRSLNIEQIGYVYEGLLDHQLARAGDQPLLKLKTSRETSEAIVSLSDLDVLPPAGRAAFLARASGREEAVITNELAAADEEDLSDLAGDVGPELAARAASYARVIVSGGVIPPDALYVTAGQSRRATGTHYTPQSLTAPIVATTLGPLVYERFEVVEDREPRSTLRAQREEDGAEPQSTPSGPREKDKNLGDLRALRGSTTPARWVGVGLKAPRDILNLKVCDMAMGSGAFLVQACRYLADRLVEAWDQREVELNEARPGEGAEPQSTPSVQREKDKNLSDLRALRGSTPAAHIQITPFGDPSTARPQERLLPENREERLALARRLVAERCLYGVDKNPLAVEMARLSLWLATLAKDRPFTFLNHALKCGDSLVGADVYQFLTWPQDVKGTTMPLLQELLKNDLLAAAGARRELQAFTVVEVEDVEAKARLHAQAEAALARIRLGCDLLVGAKLAEPDARRQKELQAELVERFIGAETRADILKYEAAQKVLAAADKVRPFHWPFEFPEVFLPPDADPATPTPLLGAGFDAFVGNPPFLGGTRISTVMGSKYFSMLRQEYPTFRNRADLCVLFFLRAHARLNRMGSFGLIATNTIAQGDSREAGLDQIVSKGGIIYAATTSMPWPGEAAVFVSIVHVILNGDLKSRVVDGEKVKQISSRLDDATLAVNPKKLATNQGKSFTGSKLDGIGFVIEPDEAQALIEKDSKNKNVLFPYLVGRDLNSEPDQSSTRWVINFSDWKLEDAEKYPDCLSIVRERVYPDRKKHKEKRTREHWWQFQRTRAELYQSIRTLDKVMVVAQVTKYWIVALVENDLIYSHRLVVFSFDDFYHFSLMQSSLMESWVMKFSATLKGDISFTPSDSFDTFPFPQSPPPQQQAPLERIGEQYHEHRRQLMLARQEGLTATYNRFHNPSCQDADIAELRWLHVEMDHVVLAAYGWSDLALDHAFRGEGKDTRFTLSEGVKAELLRRLLLLNFEIAEKEEKTTKGTKGKRGKEENREGVKSAKGKKGNHKEHKGEKRQEKNISDLRALRGSKPPRQTELPGLEDDRPRQLGLFEEE